MYGLLTIVFSFICWANGKVNGEDDKVLFSNFWKWGTCFVLVFYLFYTAIALKAAQ